MIGNTRYGGGTLIIANSFLAPEPATATTPETTAPTPQVITPTVDDPSQDMSDETPVDHSVAPPISTDPEAESRRTATEATRPWAVQVRDRPGSESRDRITGNSEEPSVLTYCSE